MTATTNSPASPGNDNPADPADAGAAQHGGGAGVVINLAEQRLRRRAHLEHLLEIRPALAQAAAEQRSHGHPDRWTTTRLLYSVEAAIYDLDPDLYDQRFPDWAAQDDALLHSIREISPTCGICRGIADYNGINIQPPDQVA